jgi:hydroxypyruvate reductase
VLDGVVVASDASRLPRPLLARAGSHPVPNAASERGGRALLEAVRAAPRGGRVVALISGGASALVAVPAPGLALADKAAACAAVMAAGAPIGELNAVRKHLSAIKGGRLAAASAAPVLTLVCSDVVGDDLATVGSGLTVPDPTTFADARAVIEARCGMGAVPRAVASHLARARDETPKAARPGDRAELVAGTGLLVDCAVAAARRRGLRAEVFGRGLVGDVAEVADLIARRAREAAARGAGLALIAGGEPTIALPPKPGLGGRAQHLALMVAKRIRGLSGVAVLVAGSDGVDGATDAAGAVVEPGTWDAIAATGEDPDVALARFAVHRALDDVEALVVTGPTGVNHADLVVIVVG